MPTAGGPLNEELIASYHCAEEVARKRARNFYYSFVVLPPEKRRAICAVYAFMRYCDDVSDGNTAVDDKRAMLERWRAHLHAGLAGDFRQSPILPAFHDSVRRFSIPDQYFHWIIDGAEMDLTLARYDTFDDLYRYCFNVASAVGLVCLQIFGYQDERARAYAESCGIAFQLTNILRDIREDAEMGRIYIPQDDLDRFHYSVSDLKSGIADRRFLDLMAFETGRAQGYYTQARNLLPLVDRSSRPALWAMMEIYGRILGKIVRHRFDVFRNSARLSGSEKAGIALKALAMKLFS
jgi:phytoene synthase